MAPMLAPSGGLRRRRPASAWTTQKHHSGLASGLFLTRGEERDVSAQSSPGGGVGSPKRNKSANYIAEKAGRYLNELKETPPSFFEKLTGGSRFSTQAEATYTDRSESRIANNFFMKSMMQKMNKSMDDLLGPEPAATAESGAINSSEASANATNPPSFFEQLANAQKFNPMTNKTEEQENEWRDSVAERLAAEYQTTPLLARAVVDMKFNRTEHKEAAPKAPVSELFRSSWGSLPFFYVLYKPVFNVLSPLFFMIPPIMGNTLFEADNWASTLVISILCYNIIQKIVLFRLIDPFIANFEMRRKRFSEYEARDEDSNFLLVDTDNTAITSKFNNFLNVHFKRATPESDGVSLGKNSEDIEHVFLHGFGANADSFKNVIKMLPVYGRSSSIALDLPGFGLTERIRDLGAYDLRNTGGPLTNKLIDQIETNENAIKSVLKKEDSVNQQKPLIYVGHSMGAIPAIAAANAQDPSRVRGVVLVAPAVMVPRKWEKKKAEFEKTLAEGVPKHLRFSGKRISENSNIDNFEAIQNKLKHRKGGFALFKRRTQFVIGALMQAFAAYLRASYVLLVDILSLIAGPILNVFLSLMITSSGFWKTGVTGAWKRKDKITSEDWFNYMKPALVKGAETGLLRFTRAKITRNRFWQTFKREFGRVFMSPEERASIRRSENEEAFHDLYELSKKDVPIFIVHGSHDSVIDPFNTYELFNALPGDRVGVRHMDASHVPHEELPLQFLQQIHEFRERTANGTWSRTNPGLNYDPSAESGDASSSFGKPAFA